MRKALSRAAGEEGETTPCRLPRSPAMRVAANDVVASAVVEGAAQSQRRCPMTQTLPVCHVVAVIDEVVRTLAVSRAGAWVV